MRWRGTGLRGGAAGPPRRLLLRHCQLMLSVSTHCVSFMHSNIECKNLSSQICLCLCNFKRISHNQTRYIQISKDCLSRLQHCWCKKWAVKCRRLQGTTIYMGSRNDIDHWSMHKKTHYGSCKIVSAAGPNICNRLLHLHVLKWFYYKIQLFCLTVLFKSRQWETTGGAHNKKTNICKT